MKWPVVAFAALLTLPFLASCGGGGGGSSTTSTSGGVVPPADPPVCSAAISRSSFSSSQGPLGGPGIFVPSTTIEHDQDVGVRAHTNHLISLTHARSSGPGGLVPNQVRAAYGITGTGVGAIAVIDAYHYDTATADFNVFSSQFGLPMETSSDPLAATNAVFQVVYAAGAKPASDGGWAQESALDTQWVHAMAPNAKVYLVEAASAAMPDLMQAVKVASALPGVRQVSMSFGITETACLYANYDSYFATAGVTYFSAAGDTGGERDFPALSKNVVGCGGTTLNVTKDGTRVGESVWKDTGCGPSIFEPRPTFQDSISYLVQRYRGGCDIAAVGDPNTGCSVYDSIPVGGLSGWLVIGGTSASTPILAAITNTSGIVHANTQALISRFMAGISGPNFNDIFSGTAGGFRAGAGWDYPSGVGTPNGTAGF